MTIKDILLKISHLKIKEKRMVSDEYGELVFSNNDIKELCEIFTSIFREPVKKQGIRPSRDILSLTENYGGLREDQTLFKKDDTGNIIIAMLWPWQDNLHTTLKMAVIKR